MPKIKETTPQFLHENQPKHDNPNHAGMTSHRKRSEAASLTNTDFDDTENGVLDLLNQVCKRRVKGEARSKRQKNRSPKKPS